LARITIYPIKSLDGINVDRATLLGSGALEHDRQFAIRDRSGDFLNGKRTDAVHGLRLSADLGRRAITLSVADDSQGSCFHLDADRRALEDWLRRYFEFEGPLELAENRSSGFPDDTEAPGPTIVSTATLEAVARWFDLPLDETRRRFRANLEIGGVEPFWEDRLFAEPDQVVRFLIGNLSLEGTNPCQRCSVPGRDSLSGAVTPSFAKRFAERRKSALPQAAAVSRFDHFYRLAVNTRPLGGEGGAIRLGDLIQVVGVFAK
jgi:uncharacterized protein YcbX